MGNRFILLALAASMTVGCYSHFDLPLESVRRLDGFRDGQQRVMATTTGEHVAFDRDTILSFHDEGGEPVYVDSAEGLKVDRDREARLAAISIEGSLFVGTTRSHDRFTIDLRETRAVHAKKPNALMTALAIVFPTIIVTALAFAIFVPVCQSTSCFGTGW